MSILINMWLQDEIQKHAAEMACVIAAENLGGKSYNYFAQDNSFQNEDKNPTDGSFNYKVFSYSDREKTFLVELSIRDVFRDYVST